MRDRHQNICIKLLDYGINLCVMIVFLFLLLYGCYEIWDSQQIYNVADFANYQMYKPDEKKELSFEELKKINPDVQGWLSVFGTKIDYPLLQGEDNQKYISTDAHGKYSMAGSIFLDSRNAVDFTDFNTIIFGHHMEKSAMFGDLELFFNQIFFETHKYGNIFYNGKNHGLEFFAFMEIDAFDPIIYTTPISQIDAKEIYLENIVLKSKYYRDIGISKDDHLVLLSTCTENTTNGRHVLVGRISDNVFPNPKSEMKQSSKKELFQSGRIIEIVKNNRMLIFIGCLSAIVWFVIYRRRQR